MEVLIKLFWSSLWFFGGAILSHYLFKYFNYRNAVNEYNLKNKEKELYLTSKQFNTLCSQMQQVVDFINDNECTVNDD